MPNHGGYSYITIDSNPRIEIMAYNGKAYDTNSNMTKCQMVNNGIKLSSEIFNKYLEYMYEYIICSRNPIFHIKLYDIDNDELMFDNDINVKYYVYNRTNYSNSIEIRSE